MTAKVAVLQFPGINSEYETRRSAIEAGMNAEFFRWNDDPVKLDNYDGFIIAGGFSYEDRGRAGLIASMDPVMEEIRVQADKGKPVLGICNGAQVLVETGLVPGGENKELLLCLARNKRVKEGKVLGTGFYNENVNLKHTGTPNRCAFTLDYEPDELAWAPVAHGEGRFTTTVDGLFKTLEENGQIVFRYSDEKGIANPDFPVNPNGTTDNAAAICNTSGNVMAIMPHPERAYKTPMPKVFTSMRKYIEGQKLENTSEPLTFKEGRPELTKHSHQQNSIEFFVQLIITDNEAQTIQNALQQKGFKVKIRKWRHFQINHAEGIDQDKLAQELIDSGEVLNTNKESATVVTDQTEFPKSQGAIYFLASDMEDSAGLTLTTKLHHHLPESQMTSVQTAVLWGLQGDYQLEQILQTNIFANHHAQVLKLRNY